MSKKKKPRFEFRPQLIHDQVAADHIEAVLSSTLTDEDWREALFEGVRGRAEEAEYAMLVQVRGVFASISSDQTQNVLIRYGANRAIEVLGEIIQAHPLGKK